LFFFSSFLLFFFSFFYYINRQKLHKRDREEMVNRQRQARLHEQDTAQASHAKWLERTAMLNEIETAVRNERQRHAKEHRIQEFHRRKNNKYERDILPGPGEYHLIDRWGQGRGATKISDANPKSDVDWAIHRAKNLPGPGAVSFHLTIFLVIHLFYFLY
jgi:hypothetical protein